MAGLDLWVRWSWRDLRARWLQVAAIGLVIALGTGTFAGLQSVTEWRERSSDKSYAALNMYDLRIKTAEAATVPLGALVDAVRGIPDAASVAEAEERLLRPIQVDASAADRAILVPGMLMGVDLGGGGPLVNKLHVVDGRPLDPGDANQSVALLEANFAGHYRLPTTGLLRISGGHALQYVGHALAPEYFIVISERGGFLAEANFATIFTSIETVQRLTGQDGVNDLLLTLAPGADREEVRSQVEAALTEHLSGTGFTFMQREEDPAHSLNYADIRGDRRQQRVFAILILAGATTAAFNLTTRIVEAQRREIGLAMALGVPRMRIAIRPVLFGTQVALLGVAFGLVVGYTVGRLLGSVVEDFAPLPVWEMPFIFRQFATAAVLGFALPFVATLIPVVVAVRVSPIEALQSGYRAAKGGGLAPMLHGLRLPGNTFAQMPARNVLRAPRRSFLTGLGIAAAITTLVAFAGMIDTFTTAIDRTEHEVLRTSPDRIDIEFAGVVLGDGPELRAVADEPLVDDVEPALRLNGVLRSAAAEVAVRLEVFDLTNRTWTPSITEGRFDLDTRGVYIAEGAAEALRVRPGSRVTLQHPRLLPEGTIALVDTEMEVLGTHPHPFRFVAYVHFAHADITGLAGAANFAWVVPVPGAEVDTVKRQLFELDGVVSVQPARTLPAAFRDLLDEFVVIIRIVEGVILLLALLVAFNSASISIDERRREHATMFAFGVPMRKVMAMAVSENFILGVLSTLVGVLGGWLVLNWVANYLFAETLPDLSLVPTVGLPTLAIAISLGVVVVAAAPLLTWRKLRNMDIPGTLKYAE
jgi:putative ABC transport system permease protein